MDMTPKSLLRVGWGGHKRERQRDHLLQFCRVGGFPQSGVAAAAVICAANSAGWLVADWACALAGVASIALDVSTMPHRALAAACDAARCRGLEVRFAFVDPARGGVALRNSSDWIEVQL